MKVKVTRKSFWWKDTVKEKTVCHRTGEIFEAPTKTDTDRQELFLLLQSHSVEVTDEAYVPLVAKYTGTNSYQEERPDGTTLKVVVGQPITLNQSEASRLMASCVVKPELEHQWQPTHLISGGVSKEAPKVMFDRGEEPKENWVMNWGVKGGRK